MATQSEKITKLDKEVSLIQKDIQIIKTNHLRHIEKSIDRIDKVLWTIGVLVFSNLLILLRDLIL
jgi:hypothetical protein|tara:strand:+ start:34 stop:228 length:195 start_codon:yes stop_codon:yes gene_type:complete